MHIIVMQVLEYVANCGAGSGGLSQRDVDAYQMGAGQRSSDEGTADAFRLLDKFQFPRARSGQASSCDTVPLDRPASLRAAVAMDRHPVMWTRQMLSDFGQIPASS